METAPEDSVVYWVGKLRGGDAAAARRLWERYFQDMVALARRKLWRAPCRGADEEDVALSAFKSFCHGLANGRFPGAIDSGNLWQLLFSLTARKAVDLIRRESRVKRGGAAAALGGDMEGLADPVVRPDLAALLDEQVHYLLEGLGDPQLRAVAQWKMEGFTSAEIAARLGCTERTVERKLRVIRRLWEEEVGA
jgi:DNA-directed RNA polymerase specialized sigma24 family protein